MESEFLKPDPNLLRPPVAPTDPRCAGATADKESFAYKAACFSLYTPIAVFFLGCFMMWPVVSQQGTAGGFWLATLWSLLQSVIALTAFALAVIGLVGGCRRRAAQIIYMSVIGLVFNSGILAYYANALLLLLTR